MRVTLDRRGDYAVRAVLYLALKSEGLHKAREIAGAMDIPRGFLAQVLADLVRAEILDATAGPSGGYALARPASKITMLAVVEAAEGPVALERCVLRGADCDGTDPCAVHHVWAAAQAAFSLRLAGTTFGDLAASGTTSPFHDS
jgi:Rrf2 family protein